MTIIYLCDFADDDIFSVPNNNTTYVVRLTRVANENIYSGQLTLLSKLVLISTNNEIHKNYNICIKEKIKSTLSDLVNQNLSDTNLVKFLALAVTKTNSDPYELDIIKILLCSNIYNLHPEFYHDESIFDLALHNDNCDDVIMKLLVDKITIPDYRDISFVLISDIHSDIYSIKLKILINAGFTFNRYFGAYDGDSSTYPIVRLHNCYKDIIKQYEDENEQYRNRIIQLEKECDIMKNSIELSPDGQYMVDLAQHFADLSKLQ